MDHTTGLRPIPVFAAATRVLREAAMPEAVRHQAFEALEALARALGHDLAQASLEQLMALAGECRELNAALAPHIAPLEAVVALSVRSLDQREVLPCPPLATRSACESHAGSPARLKAAAARD
jgi:hypothetical protein